MTRKFLRASRTKAKVPALIELSAIAAVVLALWFALNQIKAGVTSGVAQLSFFTTLAVLSQAIEKLGRYFNSQREGAAARQRIWKIQDQFQAEARPTLATHIHYQQSPELPKLSVQGLKVRYPGSHALTLHCLNFSFQGGRVYALCGLSGAGKSTLFNTMMGLLLPEQGTIAAVGPTGTFSGALAYLPQKLEVAPTTLAANIAYPDFVPDLPRVRTALAAVGLETMVADLPRQELTVLGEGGRALSGGQMQRLHLARIYYHKSPIIFIDEGTSALDPETELLACQLFSRLAKEGSLVVVIAHRPSILRTCDEVLLLSDGKLVYSGPVASALATSFYTQIFGR